MAKWKSVIYQILIFIIGAVGYPCIELIYRKGTCHWVMTIIGGLAFLIIMNVNKLFKRLNIIIRASLAAIFVTLLELVSGLILNKGLNMKVWDYSRSFMNFEGQICLKFSLCWFLLCFVVLLVVELLFFLNKKARG